MISKIKLILKYFCLCLIILLLAFFSFIMFKKSFNNKEQHMLSYNKVALIDYKVYLKENNFFDTSFLTKEELIMNNRSIITSLIDYLDINYKYNMKYSDVVSGEYTYYVELILKANKMNSENENYWSKIYQITEPQKININNEKNFGIIQNVKINYEKYNNILDDFKKQHGLATDGKLEISLVVSSTVNNEKITKKINLNNRESFNIPLSQMAVDATITLDEKGEEVGNVKEIVKLKDSKFVIYKVIASLLGISAIGLFVLLINLVKHGRSLREYSILLKKILSSYDDIIVNVNTLPDVSDLNVIHVESFDELIDAHGEVRMPINCYINEQKHRTSFVLMSESIAWVYVLKDKNHKKRDKDEKEY